jgi:hypothetical protein
LNNINSYYDIDENIIENVKLHLKKHNLDANYFNIRKYFRKQKEMYMLIPTIIKKILDCKEHIIKNDDIQKLKYMFIEINKYINQHNILQKRKKFFSYNFILFILFEKLQ